MYIIFIAFKFLIQCIHSFTSCSLPIKNLKYACVPPFPFVNQFVVDMILPHRLGGHFVAQRSDAELRRIW